MQDIDKSISKIPIFRFFGTVIHVHVYCHLILFYSGNSNAYVICPAKLINYAILSFDNLTDLRVKNLPCLFVKLTLRDLFH